MNTPNRNLTSIVSYPERGTGGNNRYRGNCSPKLIEDLIGFFKPAEICDYMCGSGTTQDAAHAMGIISHCYDLHSGFDLINCEIPVIKKDAPLVYPLLITEPVQKDIRDMNGATWRDVVAAVLETCQSPVSLAYIYEQVEPYTKARKNQWWKEKVRQTLQCSPQLFVNTGRGMWALNRSA